MKMLNRCAASTTVILTAIVASACAVASSDRQVIAESGKLDTAQKQAICPHDLPELRIGLRVDWKTVMIQSTVPEPEILVPEWPGERVSSRLVVFHEPHCLTYRDNYISFVNPNAGFNWALATQVFIEDGRVSTIMAPAVPSLLTLDEATVASKQILENFESQGLELKGKHEGRPAFLVRARSRSTNLPSAAAYSSFGEMQAAWLNEDLFLEEVVVAALEGHDSTLVIRMKNMRRHSISPADKRDAVEEERRADSRENLLSEQVYFIQLEFSGREEENHSGKES